MLRARRKRRLGLYSDLGKGLGLGGDVPDTSVEKPDVNQVVVYNAVVAEPLAGCGVVPCTNDVPPN